MTRKSMMWMSAAMLALGIGLFSANTASAGWGVNINYGNNGYRNGNYGYQNRNFGYQNQGYGWNRNYRGYSNWGNGYNGGWNRGGGQGHFDYHPTEIRRHGNHLDINPGHYDYHRGGHFGHH